MRAAVVTGATNGIGRAIALRLGRDGFHVVCADVDGAPRDGSEPTADAIAAAGGSAEQVDADVARREDCERVIAAGVAAGELAVLVNNAAVGRSRPLVETTDEAWEATIAVNLTGPFMLSRAAVEVMLDQEPRRGVRGRIVNITSQHGMVGPPGAFAYAVSKGGLVQMTRQIAVDYGREGILANAVAPGKIVTGAAGDLSTTEEGRSYVWSRTPFHRLGEPDDVAGAVAFLASDDAGYVSGTNLLVDGGWMAY